MNREVSSRLWGLCAASLVLVWGTTNANAQAIVGQTTYNSLTAPAGDNGNVTTDVTANILTNTGHDLNPNKNATDAAAYAYSFGVQATTDQTVANLNSVGGGNTWSTVIVADDLTMQVDTTSKGGGAFGHFSLDQFRFLVTNENSSAITVTAHVRIFDDNFVNDGRYGFPSQTGDGGFPGTLLASYDIGNVQLAGKGSNYASVTQVSVPSASIDAHPLDFGFDQFNQSSAGHYNKRFWAGLFFTANGANVSASQLANIGSVIFDPKAGPGAGAPDYTPTTQFEVGTSSDQFAADDIDGSHVGPTANYDIPHQKAYNKNFDQLLYTSLIQSYSLDNNNNGPEANFSWLLGGNIFILPEPGTIAFLALGGLPLFGLIRRRKN